jgi:hypothetical protein
MNATITETYKDWIITVTPEQKLCAHFSFDICDPTGKKQHVSIGGDNAKRALERAREMIDMEIEFARGNN